MDYLATVRVRFKALDDLVAREKAEILLANAEHLVHDQATKISTKIEYDLKLQCIKEGAPPRKVTIIRK